MLQTRKIRILDEAYADNENITGYIANNNQPPLNAIKAGEKDFHKHWKE